MRSLTPPPDSLAGPAGAPCTGSFLGGLPSVDLSPFAPRAFDRVLRQKRWIYLAIASDDVLVALAVVRLGYIANAFSFVFDRVQGRMLAARAALAPSLAVQIGDDPADLRAAARLPG